MFRKLLCWLGSHILVTSYENRSLYEFVNCRNPTPEDIKRPRWWLVTFKVEKCLCCSYEKSTIIEEKPLVP